MITPGSAPWSQEAMYSYLSTVFTKLGVTSRGQFHRASPRGPDAAAS